MLQRTARILALSVLVLPACAHLRQPGSADESSEVRAVDASYQQALRTGDVALLERILAPEWTFFHSTGHQQSREDFLRQFRESQRSFQKFERDNIEVHVYGEAAVLTARTYRSETVEGKKFEGAVRSMFIYAKRNGQWQLVATQVTAFAPPK